MFKELFTESTYPKYKDQTLKKDMYTMSDKKDILKSLKANTQGNAVDAHNNNIDYPPAEDNRYFVLEKNGNPVAVVDSKGTMKGAKKFDLYIEEYSKPALYENLTLSKVQKILRDAFNSGWGPLFTIKYGK
jgi:maltose-binding protein MalE